MDKNLLFKRPSDLIFFLLTSYNEYVILIFMTVKENDTEISKKGSYFLYISVQSYYLKVRKNVTC